MIAASVTRKNSLSCKLPASYSDSGTSCGALDTVSGVPAQGVSVQDSSLICFFYFPFHLCC
jgi:hypothetical protein